MRKISFLVLALSLLFVGSVFAQGKIVFENPLKSQNFMELLERFTNIIFWTGLAIVPIVIVIAALYMLTAAGNMVQIAMGKRIIVNAVIGVVILLLSKGIVAFLVDFFQKYT